MPVQDGAVKNVLYLLNLPLGVERDCFEVFHTQ